MATTAGGWAWEDNTCRSTGASYQLGSKTVLRANVAPNLPTGGPDDQQQPQLPPSRIQHRCIAIGDWLVATAHGPIGSARELDVLEQRVGITLPEMVFPHNRLVLTHTPSGRAYTFDAEHALASVRGARPPPHPPRPLNPDAPTHALLKVSHANTWGQGRAAPTMVKKFDWTYSTLWPGGVGAAPGQSESEFEPLDAPDALDPTSSFSPATEREDRIPGERLGAGSEPILFFDQLILFEDELHDNGSSLLDIKVRVMPSAILVLQRFFLRVDQVAFRVFDTRVFVPFAHGAFGRMAGPSSAQGQAKLIREVQGSQWSYEAVKRELPPYKAHDLSPLSDPNWVAQRISTRAEPQAPPAVLSAGSAPAARAGGHEWGAYGTGLGPRPSGVLGGLAAARAPPPSAAAAATAAAGPPAPKAPPASAQEPLPLWEGQGRGTEVGWL